MSFICLMNLPLFFIYTRYDTHQKDFIAKLSLGNLGGSETVCFQMPNNLPTAAMKLSCSSGRLNTFSRGQGGKPVL